MVSALEVKDWERWPEISVNPRVQEFYEERRREGLSHSLAEMFAFQEPPLPKDDTVWLRGMNDLQKDMFEKIPDPLRKAWTSEAASQGNITGAVYLPQLATYPGDPRAFVRTQGEVKQRVEELGYGSQGFANIKARNDLPPPPDIDVADDIVEEKVLDMLEANPELKVTPELMHEAREAIKPHWAN
jgi:hypothetical protein